MNSQIKLLQKFKNLHINYYRNRCVSCTLAKDVNKIPAMDRSSLMTADI